MSEEESLMYESAPDDEFGFDPADEAAMLNYEYSARLSTRQPSQISMPK